MNQEVATLLERAKSGDRDATWQLLGSRATAVFNFLLRGTGNEQVASYLFELTCRQFVQEFSALGQGLRLESQHLALIALAHARYNLGNCGYLPYIIHQLPQGVSSEKEDLFELLNVLSGQDKKAHEAVGLWAAGLKYEQIAQLLGMDAFQAAMTIKSQALHFVETDE